MPHFRASVYRKDADEGKRRLLGDKLIEAETIQQVKKQMHDDYWDESMALVGGRLEVEVAVDALEKRHYQGMILLVGPDGSRTPLGKEETWAFDEASAKEQLREKGMAMIGKEGVHLIVEIATGGE